jgi:uncharacterized protein (DUF1697 family)
MDRLRASFESLGFVEVQTYIQSGNVIFKTSKIFPALLSRKIEAALLSCFGFPISVVTRTAVEMAKTIENNPFLKKPGIDQAAIDQERLHVMFLSKPLQAAALEKLSALTAAPDQCCCLGKEIHLYLPNGVSGSSLMKSPLDRVLSVVTTTRNWRTVNAIHRMCQDCGG